MTQYTGIIMLVAFFLIMYFLIIRPQNKKDKEQKEMRNAIKVGDDIVTIGGIYGKVVKAREERVTIQVGADRTKMEIARWAISAKVNADAKSEEKAKVEEIAEERKVTPKKLKKLGETAAEEVAEAVSEEPKAE